MHFIFLAIQDPISEISFLYSIYVWRNLYKFFLPTLETVLGWDLLLPWIIGFFTTWLLVRMYDGKNCVVAYQKPDSKEHESLIYPHKSIHINLKSLNHLTFFFEDKINFCKFSPCHIKAKFSYNKHNISCQKMPAHNNKNHFALERINL